MKIDRQKLNFGFSLLTLFAIAGCGGSGGGGGYTDPTPTPDTTAPVVSTVQAPAGTVNRIVTLTLTASDAVGVTEVRFFIDGVLLGTDTTSPYSIDWDTSGETEGDHTLTAEAQDAAGNIGQSAAVTATVANMVQFAVAPNGEEQVPSNDSQATAQTTLMINLLTGDVQGDLTITGLTAIAAHIHDSFAGTIGGVLIPLDPDPGGDPDLFTVPPGTMLDAAGIDRLLAGALYINIHTAAYPNGEIRGQILPAGFVLRFTDLAGFASVPQVDSIAGGRAAVTIDQLNGAVVVHAQVTGLDDATESHVHEAYAGASGSVLVSLSKDMMDPGHWFVEDGSLNAAGLAAFAAGRLYVNVHSTANPGGEIRGQILPEGITVLFTELTGEQSVPAVDTNASGLAALTFDEAGALLTLHANTRGLTDANAAHLHLAYAGVSGPDEIGLIKDGGNPAHWFAEEEPLTGAQLAALLAGETYVNVHSPGNPTGEIRGQVIPDGILFAFGHLEGSQVVPVITTMAGGTFAVTVDPVASTLNAHINTTGVDDATLAHLHDGYAGTNGAPAINLSPDMADVTHWSAVVPMLDPNQLAAFSAGRYYVNVHTPMHGGGEIRGQVAPPPVEVLFTNLSGGEEVPVLASAASGIAASTVDRETGTVTLHLNTSGAVDPMASHIHVGYAGQNGAPIITLAMDMVDPGHWSVSGAQLNDAGLADYLAGKLYVNLHTLANANGEIRGQIAPRDIQVVFSPMDGDQVEPPVVTADTGMAATTTNLKTRRFVAFINGTGVDDATSAGIHEGVEGANGAEVLALVQNPLLLSQWSGNSEPLAAADFSAYRAGRLYAQVATMAQMGAEIRGQIVPPDAAEFDDQAPTVVLVPPPGSPVIGTVVLDATATDNQGVEVVRFLVDGILISSDVSEPYSIDWDSTTVADGDVTLTAEAEDAAGNVGVSAGVLVTVMNGTPVTLTQIQTQVFTPICSVCHTGPTSVNLPSGMNLTAGNSWASLVNVSSIQVPGTDRVEPGQPGNSYLINKLEGTGLFAQMPFLGTPLSPATIAMIEEWITNGALNN